METSRGILFLKALWWSRTDLCSLFSCTGILTGRKVNSAQDLRCRLSSHCLLQALLARLMMHRLFLKQLQQTPESTWKTQSQSLT